MENMITPYGKHRIWSKTIAMAVVCLFSVNTLCWAYPDSQPASNKNVLATQSVFKPLIDAGIQDSAELVFEILAGIRLLHAGKTYSAVNGILAETYRNTQDKRKIEFFPDVQMANGQIIAKFKVIGREDLAFEIRYQDVRANIRPEITGETGNDVTVKDAGFYEIAPIDNLTYKNVFQESDSIVITKLSSAISQSAIARAPPDGVAPVTKVLLVNIVDKAGSSLDFPTGLYALKSYLELNYREKCIVVIKDAQLEDLEDIANFTADWSPHILGLSLMTNTSKKLDKFMASLTSLLTSKDKPLLVFGKNVSTFAPSELLKKYPQAVCVKGEGELSLSGLLQYVRGEKRLSEVPNIAYFKDGNLEESGREVLPNLASIGRIDYNAAQEYLSRGGNLWMETSRGCPWGNCTYCSTKGFWGTSIWRNKPIEVIIDELKTLEKLGAERVTFTDEEFFGYGMEGIEHAKKLALAIISSGIKMSFYINARADAICNKDDSPKEREMRIETLRLLQKAGLKIVFLGLESGSPSQLGRYAKNINLAEAEGAIGICKTLGIEMAIGWIMLEPLAKKEEILEDIDFIRRNDILRYLSSPLSQMRMYPTTSYLKMVRMEEEKLGRKLVGENIDVDNLTFQTIGYKYPDTGVIIKLMDKYSRDEYDFYNSIKWFMRFYPKAHEKEFAYIARSLELLKEYQIDFLGILCRLSTTEIMNNERVENIYKEAVKRRRDLVKEIQKKINDNDPAAICQRILGQASIFFKDVRNEDMFIEKAVTDVTSSAPEVIDARYLEGSDVFYRYGRDAESPLPSGEGFYGALAIVPLDASDKIKERISQIKRRIEQTKAFQNKKIKMVPDRSLHHTLKVFTRLNAQPVPTNDFLNYSKQVEQKIKGITSCQIYLEGIGWGANYPKLTLKGYASENFRGLEARLRDKRLSIIDFKFAVVVEELTKDELGELNSVVQELSKVPIGLVKIDKVVVLHVRDHFAQDLSQKQDIMLATDTPWGKAMVTTRANQRERLLSLDHKEGEALLAKTAKYLKNYPVNMTIDLTTIPKNGLTEEQQTDQLAQNMETLARLIAWHNTVGLNIRYVLEHNTDNAYKDKALTILKDNLNKLSSIPGVDVNELLLRVGPQHIGNDVIEISLKRLEAIKAIKSIPDKIYYIALKDDEEISGVAMPNYPAAANMGLSLAALRIAKEKGKDDYNELRNKTLRIFENIYKRYGIINNEDSFTADELELMVAGCSDVRLYYAVLYALPPIIKAAIEELRKCHEALHILLQAA